jgi:hypothetical protein
LLDPGIYAYLGYDVMLGPVLCGARNVEPSGYLHVSTVQYLTACSDKCAWRLDFIEYYWSGDF